jgi:glutathione S-transferase
MRLYYSPASPFARKCRILIREKKMLELVEEVRADPIGGGDDALLSANPIGQVPALVDDAGIAWADSPVICARLDELGGMPNLVPVGAARWEAVRREVLADGILELGVKWRLEALRPEHERSPTWMARWRAGIVRGLDAAEAQAPSADQLDIGSIALACALTWIGFRHAEIGWWEGRPGLVALQTTLEARESFQQTRPA